MSRSHPPTLLKLTERTLRDECGVQRGSRILVAVSGGPDSMALLHVFARLRRRIGLGLVAHGVDHGLRPEAAAELDLAGRLAQALDVPFDRTVVRVKDGGNLQARARAARLAALRRAAEESGALLIATAHHADDRAETVLMRILRGSMLRGLAVIPPRDGALIRPFIRAGREDILQHVERHGIAFAEDPSNRNRRFLRVRLRLDVMPLLESVSPSVVSHLNSLADELRAAPVPELRDEGGTPIPLKRAHLDQIRHALRRGRAPALVRLPGNRHVRVDPRKGTLELVFGSAGGVVARSG
jgi:tRNA(Ile)-lysidine synthase